jgi:FlaA1/EpsC-like NDP-sugar epimerase
MFRERKLFNRLQLVADVLLTCAAFPLAFWSRLHLSKVLPADLNRLLNPVLLPLQQYLWIVGLAIVCWAAAASSLGLYRISIRRSGWEKVRIALESSIIVWLFLGFLSFALKLDLSRPLIALFVLYQAAMITISRVLISVRRRHLAHSSKHCRNILIIGTMAKARKMGELVSRYSDWGCESSDMLTSMVPRTE